jgi:hypothetical protein
VSLSLYPFSPTPFIEKTILSSMFVLSTFAENQLVIDVCVYFSAPYSVPLIYVFVFRTTQLCFGYYRFVVYFEVR